MTMSSHGRPTRRPSSSLFFFSSRRRHTRSLCDWSSDVCSSDLDLRQRDLIHLAGRGGKADSAERSEEHTSELQSHSDLVCRLLLEKKKNQCETKHSSHSRQQTKNNKRYIPQK